VQPNTEPHPLVVLAACVAFAVFARGCSVEKPAPGPETGLPASFGAYQQLMGKAYAEAADQLEAGTLTSDRAAHDFIEQRAKLARDAAFQPVYDREQAELGNRQWTAAKNAALWRQFSAECQ